MCSRQPWTDLHEPLRELSQVYVGATRETHHVLLQKTDVKYLNWMLNCPFLYIKLKPMNTFSFLELSRSLRQGLR